MTASATLPRRADQGPGQPLIRMRPGSADDPASIVTGGLIHNRWQQVTVLKDSGFENNSFSKPLCWLEAKGSAFVPRGDLTLSWNMSGRIPRKDLQVQIETLSDEIEERMARLRVLQRKAPPTLSRIFGIVGKSEVPCCPGCGTSLEVLRELSEDGW